MRTAANWLSALRRSIFVVICLTLSPLALAQSEYAANWGPALGSKAPMIEANDQHGQAQNLDTLSGSNGLLFVFNRSVDW